MSIVIAKSNQVALTPSVTNSAISYSPTTPGTSTISTSGGSGDGAVSYAVADESKSICSITGSVIFAKAPGTCKVTVTKAGDANFNPVSATITVTVNKGDQVNVTAVPDTAFVYFATPAATDVITVSGGVSGTAVTATVDASATSICSVSVSSNKVTMTALKVGICVINITKSGNDLYSDYTTQVSIEVKKSKQTNLTASASPSSLTYSNSPSPTATITAAGGSGTGLVSYALDSSSIGICSLNSNVVTVLAAGDCLVNVTKAGDVNYAEATASVTIKIAKGSQAALTASPANSTIVFDPTNPATTTLATSGGSGTGAVSFAVNPNSSTICSIDGNKVTALAPGSCSIVATKAGDDNFNSITAVAVVTIAKASQSVLGATAAQGQLEQPEWNRNSTSVFNITGGNGSGALAVTGLTSTVCSVSLTGQQVTVTGLAAGTCQFQIAKDGDSNFLPATTITKSVTVVSAATDLKVTISTAGNAVAGATAAIDLTVTNLGPAKASGATVEYTLPTGVTASTPLPTGCVLTSPTKVTCSTNNILSVDGTVRFTIPVALGNTLVGGQYTSGAAVVLSSATPDSNNSNNNVSGQDANFVVNKAPDSFSKATLNNMQTGKAFDDQVTANGFPAVTYIVSAGDLPAGLNLDANTGAITGIPTGSGKYTFAITAFNSTGSFSQTFTGTIAPAPFVTAPAAGFGPNTLPAGTKITIGGVNLDLITSAIIGGKTVKIVSKISNVITLEVPNGSAAGQVGISLVYAEGTLDGGTFTYTGTTKVTPTLVVSAGNGSAGAGEPSRTLSTAVTATGIDGQIALPVTYATTTPLVCSVTANQLSFLGAGTCSISASSVANSSFNAGLSATVTLTVIKSNQTISVTLPKDTNPATLTTDAADGFDLTAAASSQLPVIFSSLTPDICDVTDDGHGTGIKAGHCKVTVSQSGDARFNAATVATMEFDIVVDSGSNPADQGDPLHPTPLPNGQLVKSGSVGFTWDRKLGFLNVQTYGVFLGKINATIEFTVEKKNYKCSVDFGVLKAMPGKTPADMKAALAFKVFKAPAPLCSTKKEAAALAALKKGYAGLQIKVSFTRYLLWPITLKPYNPQTKKAIPTHHRVVYITLG